MDKSFTNLTSKKGPSKQECTRFIEKFKSVVLLSSELDAGAKFGKTEGKLYQQKAHNQDMLKYCDMFRITIGGDYVITINTVKNERNQTNMSERNGCQVNEVGGNEMPNDSTNKEVENEHKSDDTNKKDTNATGKDKDSIQIILKPPTPKKVLRKATTNSTETNENAPIPIAPIVKSLEKIKAEISGIVVSSEPGGLVKSDGVNDDCKGSQTSGNYESIEIRTFTDKFMESGTETQEQTYENVSVFRSNISEIPLRNSEPAWSHLKENSREQSRIRKTISEMPSRTSMGKKMKEDQFDTRIHTEMLADVSSEALCRILSTVLEELVNVHRDPMDQNVLSNETSESSLDLDNNILVMSDNYYIINIEQLRSIGSIMDRIDKVLDELIKHHDLKITRSKLELPTPNVPSKIQYVCTTKHDRAKAKSTQEKPKAELRKSTGTTSTLHKISSTSPPEVLESSSSKTIVNVLSHEDASGSTQAPVVQELTSLSSDTDTVTGSRNTTHTGSMDSRPRRKSDKPKSRFQALRNSKHHQDAVNTADELLDLLTDVEKLLINNCADRYEMMLLLEQIMRDYCKSARKAVADLKKFIVTFNKNNSYL